MAERAKKGGTRAITRISKDDWKAAEQHAQHVQNTLDTHSRAIGRLTTITVRLAAFSILEACAIIVIAVIK